MDQEEELKYRRHRCIPMNVVLTTDKGTYEYRDGMVTYVNVVHLYENNKYPVIQLGLEMEIPQIAEVYEYKDTALLKLEIVDQTLDKDGNVTSSTPYISHTFSILPMYSKRVYITDTTLTEDSISEPMRSLQQFECYLYDRNIQNAFDRKMEFIPETINYAQLLLLPFLQRGLAGQSCIFTPPAQSGSLSSPIIPNGALVDNIDYINRMYGLYPTVPIVYHDLKFLYCLDKLNPNVVLENPGKYASVTFTLFDPDMAEYHVTGSYDDPDTETHWINLTREPSVEKPGSAELSASMATIVGVGNNGSIAKNTIDGDLTRMVSQRAYHALSIDQTINEQAAGEIINLTADDCAVGFLRPYKNYTFAIGESYTDSGIDRKTIYRLVRWSLNIRRNGMDEYSHQIGASLYTPIR